MDIMNILRKLLNKLVSQRVYYPLWAAVAFMRNEGQWFETYNSGEPRHSHGCRRDIYAMYRYSEGDLDEPMTKKNAWCRDILEFYPRWSRNDFLRLIKALDGDKWLKKGEI